MNLGQILETHLGWAADKLGLKVATPVFAGAVEAKPCFLHRILRLGRRAQQSGCDRHQMGAMPLELGCTCV